jgi:tRNA pseudouridine13 synthase
VTNDSGPPPDQAELPRIRATPEDFVVQEVPLYPASGEGTHLFVEIEKWLRTTEEIARQLARAAGVSARDVGYAGRKDRVAVTTQWYSLPGIGAEAAADFELDGARVLRAVAHGHKLRTGQLEGNRFELRVRNVGEELVGQAQARLAELVQRGMPNRFGPQRFGRDGRNVEAAQRLLAGKGARQPRRDARFLLSALQAEVFNRVLAERPLPLDRVELGDVARLTGSGGLFLVEDEEIDNARAQSFEISATGPIFGTKMKAPAGAVAEREASALAALGLPASETIKPPRGIRMRGARRPIRVRPHGATLERDGDTVVLRFELPAGSYASVLIEELFGPVAEGKRGRVKGAPA